ncbi:amidase family protein [Salipaludibacillus sp. CF4.18]|uniref:amidase family protein n=1 Tax=Salipaludibacillus sp. CF4.18 TaxID=3373081 RepID=UPI003EE4971F
MLNERLQKFYEEQLEELTIDDIRIAFKKELITIKELIMLYLKRIAEFDKGENGVNAILEINPEAIQLAEALDMERKESGFRSSLHGIPVLIKDNLATADKLHTSAGSLALAESYAMKDSFLVKQLREAGAIIIGKANMTEWANFMTENMKNGYSSRGGQVLNPYGPGIDCGGSSSGSAAGIAANLAMVAIGTETSGSILSPASQNSVVGVKPTVGLLSRSGIIPISITQDTAGPITRTVKDAALLLNALVAQDPSDPVTKTNHELTEFNFTSSLEKDTLQGSRIGIAREGIFENISEEEQLIMEEAIQKLKDLGAEVIDSVVVKTMDAPWSMDVMLFEFKTALNSYLHEYASTTSPKTLADIIQFNRLEPSTRLKYGQTILEKSELSSGTLTEPAYLHALTFDYTNSKEKGIDLTLAENNLDAIVYPNNLGAAIPAKAGYPSITVPAGYTSEGHPVGITFTSKAYSEPMLLKLAYAYEQATMKRKAPKLE